MKKLSLVVVFAVFVLGAATIVWQRKQMERVKVENQDLQARVAEIDALRKEVDRLRKPEVDEAELQRLRALQMEVAELRSRVSQLQPASAELARLKSGQSETGDAQAGASGGTNRFVGVMRDAMKGAAEQQLIGRLKQMKVKLNLTDEQETTIRELMLNEAAKGAQIAEKMFSGQMTKQELAEATNRGQSAEEQIKALLTPEQQGAYEEFKEEEQTSMARLAANAEMLQMQGALGLSQEQQDQVYGALYDQIRDQLRTDKAQAQVRSGDPVGWMERQINSKAKALESVLTPEQIEGYRKMQEAQLKMIRGMMPKDQ